MIGISVVAKKEWEATLNYFGLSHEEQLNIFLENIPKIMTKIYDNYLVYALKNNVEYKDYESKETTIKK